MATALAIVVLASAAVFGVWILVRMASLVRELMKTTTGLTELGIEIGRVTQTSQQGTAAAPARRPFSSN
ncbi:MAG: hypothetical protein QOD69_2630 [Solirubrobacteraceae bacterium]|jgi:hypothetical protein|nr:hypothetical protein [Solirubrobacteraceae bacterium]